MSKSTTKWLQEMQAEEKRRRKRLPAAKLALLAVLKSNGVATATINYDGEGDSSQIDPAGIELCDSSGKLIEPQASVVLHPSGTPCTHDSLTEAMEAFAWEVLALYHDGFENNEGGFGTLAIDVAKGTVTLDHNDRIINVCNTLTEV